MILSPLPRVISTESLTPDSLSGSAAYWTYCGLDCCITREVWEEMSQGAPPWSLPPYRFMRALSAATTEMTARGTLLDSEQRLDLTRLLSHYHAQQLTIVGRLSRALVGWTLNPNSPAQLGELLYSRPPRGLGLPSRYYLEAGESKLTTSRQALESIRDSEPQLAPFISAVLVAKASQKLLGVLRGGIDPDGRFRASYSVGGTDTGRLSSSKSPFGSGSNNQNLTERLRRMFIPDPGKKMAYLDLSSAESFCTGYLAGDPAYIAACNAGDIHTAVARMVWPHLPWTGEPKADRTVADQLFYRQFSYRDLAKRGGHGCLTPDHEVLTPEGWVPITQKPPIIAEWDRGEVRFSPVSHWLSRPFSGYLVSLEGQAISACMTPDHRIPTDQGEIRAEDLPRKPHLRIPTTGELVGGRPEASPSPALARHLAAYHLSGLPHDPDPSLASPSLAFGPPMLSWSQEALQAYLSEIPLVCGTSAPGGVFRLTTSSLPRAAWIQTLAKLSGHGSQLRPTPNSSSCWTVSLNRRAYAQIGSAQVSWVPYSGPVFCPTIPTGWFLIRRHNKISVTGNSNYMLQPPSMAAHLKISEEVAWAFQQAYFRAFPGIPRYHQEVALRISRDGFLQTPLGRTRIFHGQPTDPATIRAAVASVPQSMTADILDLGLVRIHQRLARPGYLDLLAQVHDAVLFQYLPEHEDWLIPEAIRLLEIPVPVGGRTMLIPAEAMVGWNWAKADPKRKLWPDGNPRGLQDWKG